VYIAIIQPFYDALFFTKAVRMLMLDSRHHPNKVRCYLYEII